MRCWSLGMNDVSGVRYSRLYRAGAIGPPEFASNSNCYSVTVMDDELLSTEESARRLGITAATLYDWLGRSDCGLLVIRGQQTAINYLQGGEKGQGRIKIAASEVERIKELMRVRPTRHQSASRPRGCWPIQASRCRSGGRVASRSMLAWTRPRSGGAILDRPSAFLRRLGAGLFGRLG